jgi:hypothetical protein
MTAELDPHLWAELHFSDLDLGDLRCNQRVITVASAMAHKPGNPIPQLFDRWRESIVSVYCQTDEWTICPQNQ